MKNNYAQKHKAEFLEMLDRCRLTVFKVCYMFTDRKRGSVQDLFQDIVANLWRGYGSLRQRESERAWVYRVALHTAVDQHRRHSKGPPLAPLDDALCDTLADNMRDELVERLYELIDRLAPDDRQLVFLYLDGLSAKEMAAATGRAVSTVKNRLHKIKQQLIKMNEDED